MTRLNDSKMSGVSPFFSAEDINVAVTPSGKNVKVIQSSTESMSSYYTCNSTVGSGNKVNFKTDTNSSFDECKENIKNSYDEMYNMVSYTIFWGQIFIHKNVNFRTMTTN